MRYIVLRKMYEKYRAYGPFEDHATAYEFAHEKETQAPQWPEMKEMYHIISLDEVD